MSDSEPNVSPPPMLPRSPLLSPRQLSFHDATELTRLSLSCATDSMARSSTSRVVRCAHPREVHLFAESYSCHPCPPSLPIARCQKISQ